MVLFFLQSEDRRHFCLALLISVTCENWQYYFYYFSSYETQFVLDLKFEICVLYSTVFSNAYNSVISKKSVIMRFR